MHIQKISQSLVFAVTWYTTNSSSMIACGGCRSTSNVSHIVGHFFSTCCRPRLNLRTTSATLNTTFTPIWLYRKDSINCSTLCVFCCSKDLVWCKDVPWKCLLSEVDTTSTKLCLTNKVHKEDPSFLCQQFTTFWRYYRPLKSQELFAQQHYATCYTPHSITIQKTTILTIPVIKTWEITWNTNNWNMHY